MATVPAIVGTARLGNFRLGYESARLAAIRSTRVRILIAGVESRVRIAGLTIHDLINDAPNTCSFVIDSPAPMSGQTVRITINADTPRLLFNGTIQQDDLTYEGKPTQLVYPVRAIDDTVRLTRRRPFGTWTNVSVTTIAQTIIATYAPGITATHVQASLPATTITFDGTDDFAVCLKRLATAIGGYWYIEDGDVHLFTEEVTDTPNPIASGYPFCHDPPVRVSTDVSQLRTRQCGKGHGEAVPIDVAAGETIIPIDDEIMFNPLGGRAIAGTTPDGAQSQLITYTGVHSNQGGALVGPGNAPSVKPALTLAGGSGLGAGVYQYAYTWVTGAGETLPSPLGTVTTGDTADPSAGPTATADTNFSSSQAGLVVGDTLQFALSFSYDFGDSVGVTDLTVGGSIVVPAWVGGGGLPAAIYYSATFTPPPIARYYHVWVSKNGGTYKREITNVASAGYIPSSLVAFFPTGGVPPAVNRTVRQVLPAGIAVGPAGTTSRKVYRTAVGGAQLKLQQTIANNTVTTAVLDVTADGSLGANAPTSDTAGLTPATGQVNSGSTALITAGAGPFSTVGGWVFTAAGDRVRYTGISGNNLTGIPATGIGAILTSIPYGSLVVPAPALSGVSGLTLPMQRGTTVHIWIQRDDLAAQATQAAIDAANGLVPADGIYEGPPIVDERRGEESLIALCDATLRLYATPIRTVPYATRDVKTKSGKPLVVNLTSPPISQTLTIQEVTITEIDVAPGLAPKFTASASTVRFSLDDLLRRLQASLHGDA